MLKPALTRNPYQTCLMALVALTLLLYLPNWGQSAWNSFKTSHHEQDIFFSLAALYLGVQRLRKTWNDPSLAEGDDPGSDQMLGSLLIFGGAAAFIALYTIPAMQAIAVVMVGVGLLCTLKGLSFCFRHWLPLILITLGLYPTWRLILWDLWLAFTPPYTLETLMAIAGTQAIKLLGHPAVADGRFVNLAGKTVEVATGCNGFDMSVTLGATGLLIGLFFKRGWGAIAQLLGIGIATSMILNIPRIVLLVFAIVYWGEKSFQFWHGTIGGQIFSGLMFTLYYYIAMPIANRQPAVPPQASTPAPSLSSSSRTNPES